MRCAGPVGVYAGAIRRYYANNAGFRKWLMDRVLELPLCSAPACHRIGLEQLSRLGIEDSDDFVDLDNLLFAARDGSYVELQQITAELWRVAEFPDSSQGVRKISVFPSLTAWNVKFTRICTVKWTCDQLELSRPDLVVVLAAPLAIAEKLRSRLPTQPAVCVGNPRLDLSTADFILGFLTHVWVAEPKDKELPCQESLTPSTT